MAFSSWHYVPLIGKIGLVLLVEVGCFAAGKYGRARWFNEDLGDG